MIDRGNELALVRQCSLLGVLRSGVYYRGREAAELDLRLMRLIDEVHLRHPFYGSRRIRDWLETQGHRVNRKKVQQVMCGMGLVALYPKCRTSLPCRERIPTT